MSPPASSLIGGGGCCAPGEDDFDSSRRCEGLSYHGRGVVVKSRAGFVTQIDARHETGRVWRILPKERSALSSTKEPNRKWITSISSSIERLLARRPAPTVTGFAPTADSL